MEELVHFLVKSHGIPVKKDTKWIYRNLTGKKRHFKAAHVISTLIVVLILAWIFWLSYGGTDRKQIRVKIAIASSSANIIEGVLQAYEKYQTSAFRERGLDFSLHVDKYTNEQYYHVMDNVNTGNYDIIMMDNPFIYQYKNDLSNLNTIDCGNGANISESMKKKFIPSLLSECIVKVNGKEKLIGLPFTGNVLMMLTNQKVIESSNIPDSVAGSIPVRLNPIINKVVLYKDSLTKMGLNTPVSIRTDIRNYLPEIFWELLRAQGYEDKTQSDTCIIIDKQKADSALAWLHMVVGREIRNNLTAENNTKLLSEGKIAMTFGWTNWIGTFLKDNETSRIEVVKVSETPLLGAWILSIPESSNNKCQALRIIKDLCTEETIQNNLAENGITPVYAGFSYSIELLRRNAFWNQNARNIEDAMTIAKPRPKVLNWKEIEDVIATQILTSLQTGGNKLQNGKYVKYR